MFHELLVKSQWLLTNLTLTAQKQYIYMLAQLCPVVAIICSGYGILSYYVPVQLTSVLTVTTNIACLLTNFLLHLLHHRSQSLVLIISYIFCFSKKKLNHACILARNIWHFSVHTAVLLTIHMPQQEKMLANTLLQPSCRTCCRQT